MLTVTAICNLYAWLYTSLPLPVGTWDHLIEVDGAYAGVKTIDGTPYVMFRGSTTFMDWRQDFKDAALPFHDPVLGPIHPGFREGVLMTRARLDEIVGEESPVIVGHSLGAGHAAIYAGYRAAEGKPVAGLVMFGEPKPGGPQLSKILENVPVQSYRNQNNDGHDRVTDVPFTDFPLLPYQHVRDPLLPCEAWPRQLDPWAFFKFHHFFLYCKAFGCGGPAALSLDT